MSLFQRFSISGGNLIRKVTQPSEDAILADNARVRLAEPGALRDLTFAGHELRIPEITYYDLRKKYPDLASPDPEIRTKAWRRFSATSEADPFRLRERKRSRAIAPISRRLTTTDKGHH